MMNSKFLIWIVINSVIGVCVIAYLVIRNIEKPDQAFVINQELFAGFNGRSELNQKLEYVKERHKQVLDSLFVQMKNEKDEEGLKSLSEKSRKFISDEQELSERYTQQIWKQINAYVNDYGKENDYEMIFGANGSGSLMYAREAVNVTDEVLEYINKRYEGEK